MQPFNSLDQEAQLKRRTRIIEIIGKVAGKDVLRGDVFSQLSSHELDSLHVLEIVVECEREFERCLPDDVHSQIYWHNTTFAELINGLDRGLADPKELRP
jgi:acyl carrier protein